MGCVSKFSHRVASMTAGPAKNDRISLLPSRGQFPDLRWVSPRATSGQSQQLSPADTPELSELTVTLASTQFPVSAEVLLSEQSGVRGLIRLLRLYPILLHLVLLSLLGSVV